MKSKLFTAAAPIAQLTTVELDGSVEFQVG
jgi:hypothetical protein